MSAAAEDYQQYENQYPTLGDVNNRLKEMGLRKVLTGEGAKLLQQDVSKGRFARALYFAGNDQRALDFVKELVNRLGVDIAPEQQTGGQPQQTPANSGNANAAPEQGSNARSNNQDSEEKKEFKDHHVYGSKAALCFSNDITRRNVHTIRLEGASAVGRNQYDWKNTKIAVQITSNELPCLIAVFAGMIPEYKADNHGTDNDQGSKGFAIQNQNDKLFVRIYQGGGTAHAVPVTPEDAFWSLQLMIEQMQLNMPGMSAGDILAMVGRTVGRMKGQQAQQQ